MMMLAWPTCNVTLFWDDNSNSHVQRHLAVVQPEQDVPRERASNLFATLSCKFKRQLRLLIQGHYWNCTVNVPWRAVLPFKLIPASFITVFTAHSHSTRTTQDEGACTDVKLDKRFCVHTVLVYAQNSPSQRRCLGVSCPTVGVTYTIRMS